MPKRVILPPEASIAAGITSWRSAMAEAPITSTRSALLAAGLSSAAASAALSWGTRLSSTGGLPSAASRSFITATPLSNRIGFIPGSCV